MRKQASESVHIISPCSPLWMGCDQPLQAPGLTSPQRWIVTWNCKLKETPLPSMLLSARVFYHSNRNKARAVTQSTCAGTGTSSPCPQLEGTLDAFRRLTGIKAGFPSFVLQCAGRRYLKSFGEESVNVNVKLGENLAENPFCLKSFYKYFYKHAILYCLP